jgi:glycosyltransferase involved in cell wall biosynthesis
MSISVITPVAPYHIDKINQVSATVQAQTISCEHIIVIDEHSRGAGWARNEGLRQCTSDYVIFLDADDTIDTMFAEKCRSIIKPNHYVYTAWFEGDKGVMPLKPCEVWRKNDYHVITTLIETHHAKAIGFNEQYLALEDVAFYLALIDSGVCGMIYPEPLFRYHSGGKRSHSVHNTPYEINLLQELRTKYRRLNMACCNGSTPKDETPTGTRLEGDVLARVVWGGNRIYVGRQTRRNYGRIGLGKLIWISPLDIHQDSASFSVLDEPSTINAIQVGSIDNLGTYLFGHERPVYHEAKGKDIPLDEIAKLL